MSNLSHKQWLEQRIKRFKQKALEYEKRGATDEEVFFWVNRVEKDTEILTHLNSQLAKLPDNKDIILHARKRADEYSDNLGERIEIRENMREASRWMKEQIKRIIG